MYWERQLGYVQSWKWYYCDMYRRHFCIIYILVTAEQMSLHVFLLRLVHTDCGNGNGKNGLYWALWVAIAFAAGLHVNTSIRSNKTNSWWRKYLSFHFRCRSQCEQAFTLTFSETKEKPLLNNICKGNKILCYDINIWNVLIFSC